jgi:biopolymer transport protein TolR
MGMSTGNNGGKGRSTMSEINVTPLVDVMLVLLIIFMVTAPMIQQGVDVDLPQTETVEITPDDGKSMLVINEKGEIFIGETLVAIDDLEEKIRFNEKIQSEKVIYLYADKNLRYELVARVMSILKKAGVSNLGMVTEPLDSQAAGTK